MDLSDSINEENMIFHNNDDNNQSCLTKDVIIESNEIEIERNCEVTNEQITDNDCSINENDPELKTIMDLLDYINKENMIFHNNDDNNQSCLTKDVPIESNEIEIERNCEITNEQITDNDCSINENIPQFKTIMDLLDYINDENMIFHNNEDNNQSCYTKDVTEDNCSNNIEDDTKFDTIYSLLDLINKENTIFQNEDNNKEEDVINRSNKITLSSFNICSSNNLEKKPDNDCKKKCVQNSTFKNQEITNNLHSDNNNEESCHSKVLINNTDKNDSKNQIICGTSEKSYEKRLKKSFSQSDCLNSNFFIDDIICDFCNKSFKNSKNFKRHMNIHSEIKKYTCAICHKMFTQPGNLKRHMVIHSNTRPYKCHICEQPFSRKDDLKRHTSIYFNNPKKSHNLYRSKK